MGGSAKSQLGAYTLRSGTAGLVGSMLVRDPFRHGTQAAEWIRPTRQQTAFDRIDSVLRFWDGRLGVPPLTDPTFDPSNLDRLAGDVTCPRLDEQVLERYLKCAPRTAWGEHSLLSLPQSTSYKAIVNAA